MDPSLGNFIIIILSSSSGSGSIIIIMTIIITIVAIIFFRVQFLMKNSLDPEQMFCTMTSGPEIIKAWNFKYSKR